VPGGAVGVAHEHLDPVHSQFDAGGIGVPETRQAVDEPPRGIVTSGPRAGRLAHEQLYRRFVERRDLGVGVGARDGSKDSAQECARLAIQLATAQDRCGLTGQAPGEIEIAQREPGVATSIEHLEHAYRPPFVGDGGGEDRARHVAGRRRDRRVEPSVCCNVGDRQRLARGEGIAGDAGGCIDLEADDAVPGGTRGRNEDQAIALGVMDGDRGRGGIERDDRDIEEPRQSRVAIGSHRAGRCEP